MVQAEEKHSLTTWGRTRKGEVPQAAHLAWAVHNVKQEPEQRDEEHKSNDTGCDNALDS